MASRIMRSRALLTSLESALESFKSSATSFRVIRTVSPNVHTTQEISSSEAQIPSNPKTLFILDSSYNPPSRAHFVLASTALSTTSEPSPHRLLLLFSTHNADKSPSPAPFIQRIAMMVLLAEDLQLQSHQSPQVPVDIGLTTAPYYTDKSVSIANAEPSPYPSNPTHVHLLGYDTLTRFLAPKYYQKFSPPLSALEPYFGTGHKLLVLLRPDSSSDNAVTGETEDEQRAFITGLEKGSLADSGMKPEWAKQIGILEGKQVRDAVGISSTAIRKAAQTHDWGELGKMCTPGVSAWIEDQKLYEADDRRLKMA